MKINQMLFRLVMLVARLLLRASRTRLDAVALEIDAVGFEAQDSFHPAFDDAAEHEQFIARLVFAQQIVLNALDGRSAHAPAGKGACDWCGTNASLYEMTGAWYTGRKVCTSCRNAHTTTGTEVVNALHFCDAPTLVPTSGELYRFQVKKDCEKCARMWEATH